MLIDRVTRGLHQKDIRAANVFQQLKHHLAIGEALQRISQLVTDFPQIAELDINPFIVGKMGEDSIAADARIQLAPGGVL